MELKTLLQLIMNGLMIGATYGLIALGLTVVFSIMRVVNFAHGELYMLGGFIAYYFFAVLRINYFLTLLITAFLLGLMGILLERFIFRNFRENLLGSLIISFGVSLTFQNLTMNIFGVDDKSIPSPFPGVIHIFSAPFPKERLVIIAISISLLVGLHFFLQKAKVGQAMRAIAQNSEASILCGVNINTISALTLALGSSLAGVSGALLGPIFYINPFNGVPIIMNAFNIIIIGGMGSIPGCILAGLILGLINSFGTYLFNFVIVSLIFFTLLIIILLFKPSGLLGRE
jgi:branched-chain amino acid transport system permease protein